MHKISPLRSGIFRFETCKCVIWVCWIAGLLLGMAAAYGAGDVFSSLMRGWQNASVSIVGLSVTSLPFLFTAIAVFLPAPLLLVPAVLFRAFLYGYCALGITLAYGDAAWLVRLLLMLSDTCSTALLMWLWLRCGDPKVGLRVEFLGCTLAALGLKLLDFCAITPFTALFP